MVTMTQSHYEINVSLDGKHFFATAPRGCTTLQDAFRVYCAVRGRFPERDGYEIKVKQVSVIGQDVTADFE